MLKTPKRKILLLKISNKIAVTILVPENAILQMLVASKNQQDFDMNTRLVTVVLRRLQKPCMFIPFCGHAAAGAHATHSWVHI